jgi:hypothetical protein
MAGGFFRIFTSSSQPTIPEIKSIQRKDTEEILPLGQPVVVTVHVFILWTLNFLWFLVEQHLHRSLKGEFWIF